MNIELEAAAAAIFGPLIEIKLLQVERRGAVHDSPSRSDNLRAI